MANPAMPSEPDLPAQPASQLSTNAVAVLGLLAVAPMTAYTLVEQVTRRALLNIWTMSRRLAIAEPRRLAGLGLVEAVAPEAGSRAGQRWVATDRGRAALQAWLATPVAVTETRSELLLRLVLADAGTLEDLRVAVLDRRRQIADELRFGMDMLVDYLATGGPFPGRLHITAACMDAVCAAKFAEQDFVDRLLEEIDHWPDTTTADPERHRPALQRLLAEVAERVGRV